MGSLSVGEIKMVSLVDIALISASPGHSSFGEKKNPLGKK